MPNPLVSVIVLSYNNFQYIFEALESLIKQDYPAIELILADDCSKDFDKSAVTKFLRKNRRANLRRFSFISNEENVGTVKNLNNAIRKARGKYLIFFAADDAFYDNHVISSFIRKFEELPEEALIVTAQLGMYDDRLDRLIKPFISKRNIRILSRLNPQELFSEMADKCIIAAASTCYKTQLFKDYGYFDERYKLIEDWSSALRLSRLGVKFYYEDFVAFKHRDGGVSHGNVHGEKKLNKTYDLDLINIMENEVLPYTELLSRKQQKNFDSFYKDHKWRFACNYIFTDADRQIRRSFLKKNIRLMLRGFARNLREYFINQPSGLKFKIFIIGTLLILTPGMPNLPVLIGRFLLFSVLLIVLYQLYLILMPQIIRILRLWF